MAAGETTLNTASPTEAQQGLYSLPQSDFNQITTGTNGGYNASAGYNMVTGLGSPIATSLVSDLISYQPSSSPPPTSVPSFAAAQSSDTGSSTAAGSFGVSNAIVISTNRRGTESDVAAVATGAHLPPPSTSLTFNAQAVAQAPSNSASEALQANYSAANSSVQVSTTTGPRISTIMTVGVTAGHSATTMTNNYASGADAVERVSGMAAQPATASAPICILSSNAWTTPGGTLVASQEIPESFLEQAGDVTCQSVADGYKNVSIAASETGNSTTSASSARFDSITGRTGYGRTILIFVASAFALLALPFATGKRRRKSNTQA